MIGDNKQVTAGLAVLGALGLAALGLVKFTTPEAVECKAALADKKAELADKAARLELTAQAMKSCEAALNLCAGVAP